MVLYQELETKMGEVMLCPLLNKSYDPAVAATGVVSEASKKPLPVVLAEIQVYIFLTYCFYSWICSFLAGSASLLISSPFFIGYH